MTRQEIIVRLAHLDSEEERHGCRKWITVEKRSLRLKLRALDGDQAKQEARR